MKLDLGKNPFKKFTKSALVEMLEDAILMEKDRTLPMHKRGEKGTPEKDEATKDADAEREEIADLKAETNGEASPVEMDDEDMSDEAMDVISSRVKKKSVKPKAK